jgi:hypothetical protein
LPPLNSRSNLPGKNSFSLACSPSRQLRLLDQREYRFKMPKRAREWEQDVEVQPPSKRSRSHQGHDYLSGLSSELLLRIFSYLPLQTLIKCEGYVLIQFRFGKFES